MHLLVDALRGAGFTIIDSLSHKFPGTDAGVTGMVLLSESHAAIHTYPEFNFIALDVFSCGPPDPVDVLENLTSSLQPERIEKSVHAR
jgi:S-adenosylmethionine decarboxylase